MYTDGVRSAQQAHHCLTCSMCDGTSAGHRAQSRCPHHLSGDVLLLRCAVLQCQCSRRGGTLQQQWHTMRASITLAGARGRSTAQRWATHMCIDPTTSKRGCEESPFTKCSATRHQGNLPAPTPPALLECSLEPTGRRERRATRATEGDVNRTSWKRTKHARRNARTCRQAGIWPRIAEALHTRARIAADWILDAIVRRV
jgi:hypothetical protein